MAALVLGCLACTPILHAASRVGATNLQGLKDWNQPILAEVLQNNAPIRLWSRADNTAATLDANGWPTEDARITLWAGAPTSRNGTYRVYYEGQASVSILNAPSMTVTSNVYDANTGTSTATLVLSSFAATARINFTGTTGGVRNVRVMRPIAEGATEAHAPSEVVDRVMGAQLSRMQVIRYMDTLAANSNAELTWSMRRSPGNFKNRVQFNSYSAANVDTGIPWEYIIAISNATNTDPYICLPAMADDDYYTKVAQLFRYGSDGTTPYSSTQANPVWAPLNADRKLYVEYSNEVWNTAPAFRQSEYARVSGVNLVTANFNHPLNYDLAIPNVSAIASNNVTLRVRYTAMRATEMSRIFRQVFGDDAMMTRVRPLWCYQMKSSTTDDRNGLAWVSGYYGLTEGRAPGYFFWGAGPATYRGAEGNVTIDTIWTSGRFDRATFKDIQAMNGKAVTAFGINYITYEGMPSFGDPLGANGSIHPLADAAFADPRMYDEMVESYEIFEEAGGVFQTVYTWNHDYRWATIHPTTHSDNTHRARSVYDAATTTASAPDIGTEIPYTFAGANFTAVNPGLNISNAAPTGTALITGVSHHTSYHVRTPTGGNFTAKVNYSTSGAATFLLLVHGMLAETITTTGTATNADSGTHAFTLPANVLSGVTIQKIAGANVTVNSVIVAANTTPNTVPVIQTASLPGGTVGSAYNQSLSGTGGDGSLVWSLDSGSLPTGLSLSSSGVISGTPTAGSTGNFTLRLADTDTFNGTTDEDTQALTLTIAAPQGVLPVISSQPTPTAALTGGSASFSVTATGTGTLTYQWRLGGIPISGATAATLSLTNATADDVGDYTVVLTDANGSVTSNPAAFNLLPAGFDLAGYYARNNDIATTFGTDYFGAWLHYWNYGVYEGRSFDAQFIAAEYLEIHADLKAVFGTDLQAALLHWLTWGHPIEDRLGRVPIGFNIDSYLARYPDLQAAFGAITPNAVRNVTVWNHFIDWGVREGRSDGDFEAYSYLATNPDLAAIFGTDVEAATWHWFFYGRREGRRIPANFDVLNYRTLNGDVTVVWGNDLYGCWLHYRDVGVYEGRTFDNLFRVTEYLSLNPDVATMYGSDYTGVLLHWLYYGKSEGRRGRL